MDIKKEISVVKLQTATVRAQRLLLEQQGGYIDNLERDQKIEVSMLRLEHLRAVLESVRTKTTILSIEEVIPSLVEIEGDDMLPSVMLSLAIIQLETEKENETENEVPE